MDGFLIISKEVMDFPFKTLEQEKAYAIISAYKEDGCYLSIPQFSKLLKCADNTTRKTLRELYNAEIIKQKEVSSIGLVTWVALPLTPSKIEPLQKLNPFKKCTTTPSKFEPLPLQNLNPISIYKDNINNTTTSSNACAQGLDKLKKWIKETDLEYYITKNRERFGSSKTTEELAQEFYDNDILVREDVNADQRREVLKHFQLWLPKYLNNEINNTTRNQGAANQRKAVVQNDRDMLPNW